MDQDQLLHKFITFTKQVAYFYTSLQKNKRQLCQFLKSTNNYILPFAELDLDKRGVIGPKDLQLFLIRHKYFYKPEQINRYFMKYVHGKDNLDYDDVLEALLPHSKYILISTVLNNHPVLSNNRHICDQAQNKLITHLLAVIVSQQVQFLSKAYWMMDDLTNSSHQVGALLWRYLDRQHNNELSYQKYKSICEQFNTQFSKHEWQALINWSFRNHKNTLRRPDFLELCNLHNQNKRNRSACNYEHFVMKKQQKKQCLEELERKKVAEERIKEKIGLVRGSCGWVKSVVLEEQFPERILERRVLLSGKPGYQNPRKCIKYSQVLKQ